MSTTCFVLDSLAACLSASPAPLAAAPAPLAAATAPQAAVVAAGVLVGSPSWLAVFSFLGGGEGAIAVDGA